MVRRWRDERRARLGVAEAGDELIDFVRRQLSALAGLRTLRELDLQILRRTNVFDRHAETSRGNLLDCAVPVRAEAFGIFAALARVGHRAEAVQRECDCLVRLWRKRTKRHRPADEMLDDGVG